MTMPAAEHVIPAAWVVIAAATGFVGLCGVIWAFIVWLRARTREGVEEAIHSEAFEARISRVVGAAFAGYADPVMRALADLESRQRDHGRRIGEIEKDIAGIRGRLRTERGTDA